MDFLSHLKKLDWIIIACAVLIASFSLAGIYSAGIAKGSLLNFEKQAIFFAAGILLMVAISFLDYRMLRNNPYLILIIYFFCLLLLAGTLFLGPNIRGARGWYKLGPVSLDPIEPAKIILIILLAKYFSMRHVEMYKFRHIMISACYVFLMAGFVFLRPDLGGTLVLILIWLGMLVVSGIKIRHFFILLACFMLVSGLAWQFVFKDYQKDRVIAFLFPYDELGSSWSQTQAEITIGSGRILGQGFASGSQVQYGFLPEPHTDFIFAAMGAEWGILGVAAFFAAYLVLIWRIIKIAVESQSNFPRLFAIGFSIILMVQFIINIGMNLGLLPVIGLYLPFVSYGGSGLIANFLSLGILQSIKAKR